MYENVHFCGEYKKASYFDYYHVKCYTIYSIYSGIYNSSNNINGETNIPMLLYTTSVVIVIVIKSSKYMDNTNYVLHSPVLCI